MPYSLVVKIALIAGLHFPPKVYSITVALIFLNSSINPLLYCWRDREIRTALKQLFGCWFYLRIFRYDFISICVVKWVMEKNWTELFCNCRHRGETSLVSKPTCEKSENQMFSEKTIRASLVLQNGRHFHGPITGYRNRAKSHIINHLFTSNLRSLGENLKLWHCCIDLAITPSNEYNNACFEIFL